MVKQLDDTETLCKNSSHATTPVAARNDGVFVMISIHATMASSQ
ncbi:hypothetical protein [Rickettsia endosymbiont of Orchestes rusci]